MALTQRENVSCYDKNPIVSGDMKMFMFRQSFLFKSVRTWDTENNTIGVTKLTKSMDYHHK